MADSEQADVGFEPTEADLAGLGRMLREARETGGPVAVKASGEAEARWLRARLERHGVEVARISWTEPGA